MTKLHPQLEKDCFVIGSLKLCTVLLMNNSLFPWIILVPEKENASEVFDLSESEQKVLMKEINFVAAGMKEIFGADKMNIAALGNQVPQLHIHVIARFKGDAAWPNPVWGKGSKPFSEAEKKIILEKIKPILG